jgi:DNA-binding response OmpR family regulator
MMRDAAVLVVDDEPLIRATVCEMLDMAGYRASSAANGAEALALLETSPMDVVLLDMRMPVLDGWGFAREVRERGMDVKSIVMTAARDAQAWATEIAAHGSLPKPFRMDDLLAAIDGARAPG